MIGDERRHQSARDSVWRTGGNAVVELARLHALAELVEVKVVRCPQPGVERHVHQFTLGVFDRRRGNNRALDASRGIAVDVRRVRIRRLIGWLVVAHGFTPRVLCWRSFAAANLDHSTELLGGYFVLQNTQELTALLSYAFEKPDQPNALALYRRLLSWPIRFVFCAGFLDIPSGARSISSDRFDFV